MCGIAGLIGEDWTAEQFHSLFDAIQHRGPDGSGTYTRDRLRLGMHRLRLRGSDAELPLRDGDVIAAFNGQIYGVRSATGAYSAVSQGMAHELAALRGDFEPDGMYACSMAALDGSDLFLTTDRQFIKPLFVRRDGARIAFCSEFAALLPLGGNSINAEGLAELFAYGWYLSDHSYVAAIESLCTHDLFIRGDTVRRVRKSGPSATVAPHEPAALRTAIRDSVLRCVDGTGPFGLAISGGLDSTILAWELNAAGIEGLHTLSVSLGDDGVQSLDELSLPRGGSWQTWQHHTIRFRDDRDFLIAFQQSTKRFGQPSTMSSLPLSWRLAQEAAEAGVRVLLTGEGVDELFCGYGSYSKLATLESPLDYYRHAPRDGLFTALFGAAALERVQRRFKERYAECTDLRQIERELRLMRLLIRTDVCLMSYSIEGRVPFLHNAIPELALAIPWETLAGDGGKSVLRHMYRDHLGDRARVPKRRFKISDAVLRRCLAAEDLNERISAALSPVLGSDETRRTLTLLRSEEGFDADIHCLLLSLSFLIEEGWLA